MDKSSYKILLYGGTSNVVAKLMKMNNWAEDETLEFKVFCFEAYRAENNLAEQKICKFLKIWVLDYLNVCYNVLHTTGREYIV